MPCCYQICLVKLLYSYADDLSEKTAKVAAQKGKTSTSGWRASVVQKWPCLSSPILWYTQSNATRLKLMFLRDHYFKWLNLSNIGEVMDLRPNSWGFRKIARRVFIAPLKKSNNAVDMQWQNENVTCTWRMYVQSVWLRFDWLTLIVSNYGKGLVA